MDSTQVLINSLMSANSVDELKNRLIPLLTRVASGDLGYTEYIGLISQTDDNPPVLTQQLNNTGLTFTPSYTSEGNYVIEFSSYPALEKVNVNIMSTYGKANVGASYEEGTGIFIETYDILSNVDGDNNLVNSSIIIKIFP